MRFFAPIHRRVFGVGVSAKDIESGPCAADFHRDRLPPFLVFGRLGPRVDDTPERIFRCLTTWPMAEFGDRGFM